MIDLRSDTFTMPTDEMRNYISRAPVGDDVFGEDPSVNELQNYVAELLGKEDALYVTSGVMGNQLCLAVQTNPGEEVIVEADSHIFYYENAGPSVISRVQLMPLASEKGIMSIEKIERAIRPDIYYFPKTSVVCLENTHNRHGGSVIPLNYIKEMKHFLGNKDIKLHCDGARLWEACIAKNITPKEYAEPFDSISVCLSKGLGAPVGSVISGSKDFIKSARKWRKMLGGGMRQAGIIASAGLYALQNHYEKLQLSHTLATDYAKLLSVCEYLEIDVDNVETNIVMFKLLNSLDEAEFANNCKIRGLLIIPFGNGKIRSVFHFQHNPYDIPKAAQIIIDVLNEMNSSNEN